MGTACLWWKGKEADGVLEVDKSKFMTPCHVEKDT